MLSIPETASATTVFTASYAGVYTLAVVYPLTDQSGQWRLNGGIIGNTGSPQGSWVLYLVNGDTLSYSGNACQLAGFRQGNEFEDP